MRPGPTIVHRFRFLQPYIFHGSWFCLVFSVPKSSTISVSSVRMSVLEEKCDTLNTYSWIFAICTKISRRLSISVNIEKKKLWKYCTLFRLAVKMQTRCVLCQVRSRGLRSKSQCQAPCLVRDKNWKVYVSRFTR